MQVAMGAVRRPFHIMSIGAAAATIMDAFIWSSMPALVRRPSTRAHAHTRTRIGTGLIIIPTARTAGTIEVSRYSSPGQCIRQVARPDTGFGSRLAALKSGIFVESQGA